MNEFSFINSIKQISYKQPSLVKGIGDDAAVFRSEKDIVTAVDTFVEGIHFSRETMSPFQTGYRALAANISDLAAMGARPAFYLVSVVIPKTWTLKEVEEIFSGMKELARYDHMDLIGGDTVSGSELSISITVIGLVEKGMARFRHTAQPGDHVFVTGTLGDARAGLHILTGKTSSYINSSYFVKRHQMPSPRSTFAVSLAGIDRVTLNDVSDGIGNEANEIAEASDVTITLYDVNIPVSDDFQQFPPSFQQEWKYFGGEDFELLGTVAEENWDALARIANDTGTQLTKIGFVSEAEKEPSVYVIKDNRKARLDKNGYTHLK
ncbi:thiamine-monophosphate kinase [Oceanobacillus picturae]|uniref:Thiamine-monophosphate kinase n=1 Tax=Oceanobacillus picturae TaxID=171693 RepID=A0A0U9H908_9BACI|nr:thiamine-phosphate kinase [Oceanobacillus picturae]GAQ19159.1 thiamine-monophosphate kinase [Oceanobacillus picturae]